MSLFYTLQMANSEIYRGQDGNFNVLDIVGDGGTIVYSNLNLNFKNETKRKANIQIQP